MSEVIEKTLISNKEVIDSTIEGVDGCKNKIHWSGIDFTDTGIWKDHIKEGKEENKPSMLSFKYCPDCGYRIK